MGAYDFFWHEFCDWYLEIIKPRLQEGDRAGDRIAALETLVTVLDGSLRLLHPAVPFITEELWQHLRRAAAQAGLAAARAMDSEALIIARWPSGDPLRRDEVIERQMTLLQDIVRAIRNVRKEKNLPDRSRVGLVVSAPDCQTDDLIEAHSPFLTQMAVLDGIGHGLNLPRPARCAAAVVGTTQVFLLLEKVVDIEAERARLQKQKAEVQRRIQSLEATLGNAEFLANAPPEVVQKRRQAAEELRGQLAKVQQNMADLE
jgi:valyl-tRNA synthetase